MTPAQLDAIKSIVDLFDTAENKVKEVEQFAQELSIPSINELRYVGYHLARALCEENEQELNCQIEKAKGHCKRSIYDAHEIGIMFMLESVIDFKKNYTVHSSTVLEVIPTYTDELSRSNKASRFIAEIKESHHDNRDDYYEDCVPHYDSLRDIVDKLTVAEPLINKKIIEKIESDRKGTRRFIITVLLGLLGLSITGTLLYLKLNGVP